MSDVHTKVKCSRWPALADCFECPLEKLTPPRWWTWLMNLMGRDTVMFCKYNDTIWELIEETEP